MYVHIARYLSVQQMLNNSLGMIVYTSPITLYHVTPLHLPNIGKI